MSRAWAHEAALRAIRRCAPRRSRRRATPGIATRGRLITRGVAGSAPGVDPRNPPVMGAPAIGVCEGRAHDPSSSRRLRPPSTWPPDDDRSLGRGWTVSVCAGQRRARERAGRSHPSGRGSRCLRCASTPRLLGSALARRRPRAFTTSSGADPDHAGARVRPRGGPGARLRTHARGARRDRSSAGRGRGQPRRHRCQRGRPRR